MHFGIIIGEAEHSAASTLGRHHAARHGIRPPATRPLHLIFTPTWVSRFTLEI